MAKIIKINEEKLTQIVENVIKAVLKESNSHKKIVKENYEVLADLINNGKLDKSIIKAYNDNNLYDLAEYLYDKYVDYGSDINEDDYFYVQDMLHDRINLIDKSAANQTANYMKKIKGSDEGYNDMPSDSVNKNVLDTKGTSSLNDEYWNDHEMKELGKKFPDIITKNGKVRSPKSLMNVNKNRAKYGYNDAADKTALHRKGSLNREI